MSGLAEGAWRSWRHVDVPGHVAARRACEVVEVKARKYPGIDVRFSAGSDAFDLFANAWWGYPITRAAR